MQNDRHSKNLWLTAGSMVVLTLVTFAAQRSGALTGVRTNLHDALSPGRLMMLAMSDAGSASTDRRQMSASVTPETASSAEEDLHRQLVGSEVQRRQLMIENARLRNQLRQQTMIQRVDYVLSPEGFSLQESLCRFTITPANVIGDRGLSDTLRGLIIDAGRAAGVAQSELLVDGTGLLLDKGTDSDVQAGDRVLAGAVVLGRIEKTGRWVSSVQPVTDSGFSARVQLLRTSAQGQYFGAEGILTGARSAAHLGDEPGSAAECVIDGIPYTEAVSAGDEVVSADIDGTRGPRLYFGRVTHAEFLDGGQWSIRVRPAAYDMPLESVAIVRLELRPQDKPSLTETNGGAVNRPAPPVRLTGAAL